MVKHALAVTLCAVASTAAFAGGAIDFALSNESVRIEHDAALVGSGAHFTVGGVYNESRQSMAITAGFNAVDATMANKEMVGGVGFKAIGLHNPVATFSVGLGVGGFLRWQPDFMNGLGVEGQGYFAPSILSFGDLVSTYEGVARITYKILPQARVFFGYHYIGGDYTESAMAKEGIQSGDNIVDGTFHLGFRMTY